MFWKDTYFWTILLYGIACMATGFMWGAGMAFHWAPIVIYCVAAWILILIMRSY